MLVDIGNLKAQKLKLSRTDGKPASFLGGASFSWDQGQVAPNDDGFTDVVRDRVAQSGPQFPDALDKASANAGGPERCKTATAFVYMTCGTRRRLPTLSSAPYGSIDAPVHSTQDKINVLHLHGDWRDSPTGHRAQQLMAARPHLWKSLEHCLSDIHLVVLAYSGWDDIFITAIARSLSDGGNSGLWSGPLRPLMQPAPPAASRSYAAYPEDHEAALNRAASAI